MRLNICSKQNKRRGNLFGDPCPLKYDKHFGRIITAVCPTTSSLLLLPLFFFGSRPLGPWYCWNGAELFNRKHSFVSRLPLGLFLSLWLLMLIHPGWGVLGGCVLRGSQEEGGLEQWEVRSGVLRDLFGPALYPSNAVCRCHGQP